MQHSFPLPLHSWKENFRPLFCLFLFFFQFLWQSSEIWTIFMRGLLGGVVWFLVGFFFPLFLGAASSHNGKYLLFCNSSSAWTKSKMNPQIQSLSSFILLVTRADAEYIFDKVDEMKKNLERMRIILTGSNLWSSSSPTPCSEYIHLEDVALSHI